MTKRSYQTFPGNPGASNSAAKLAALALPPLAGKSFLDVGCNEGYFCGFAAFEAARTSIGIDKDAQAIKRAQARFPECKFICGSWNNLSDLLGTEARFDIILCSSAIHYAEDQAALIALLMDTLAPRGMLALEVGIVNNPEDYAAECPGWYRVKRSIDVRLFPEWSTLKTILSPYSWKDMGPAPSQIGDPIPRKVFHIYKMLPYAVLLTGAPGSGKSTAARKLFPELKTIQGDALLGRLATAGPAFPHLLKMAQEPINWQQLHSLIWRIFDEGAGEEWIQFVVASAGNNDFVYDGFIPAPYRTMFAKGIEKHGYKTLRIEEGNTGLLPSELSRQARLETRKYELFLNARNFAERMRQRKKD